MEDTWKYLLSEQIMLALILLSLLTIATIIWFTFKRWTRLFQRWDI